MFVDGGRIAEGVFADHLLANVVLLGVAFQLGGLPVGLGDIERAMQQQGRAAADNREAFEWGRWAVHEPAAVAAALGASPGSIFDPSPAALATAAGLFGRRTPPPSLRAP